MASPDDDDLLATWLGRVAAVTEAEPGLGEDDFHRIARELGLGPDELARVEAMVAAHLTRGQNYLTHGRPADAVAELTQAQALAPWRADIAEALAEARVALYEKTGDPLDRAAAEDAVRGVLDRAPDHRPAVVLLNRLDAPPAVRTTPRRARRNALLIALAGVMLMLTISALMALLLRLAPPVAPPDRAPDAPKTPAASPTADGEAPPLGEHPLPFTVVGDGVDVAAIDFDPTGTRIERREVFTQARFKLRVTPRAEGRALDALAGTLEVVDGAGAVLVSEPLSLIDRATVPRRAGEGRVWGRQLTVPRAAVAARLRVTAADWITDAGPIAGEPACLAWAVTQPPHVALDVRLLADRVDGFTRVTDYAITNRGRGALRSLTVVVERRDADGAPLVVSGALDRRIVAGAWMPPFEPGETRFERYIKVIPAELRDRYAATCLRVTEVE
ncbi:MAG: hypothetical protein H6705_10925 [Myxococcales bacterium]|nr:hypothetical protein [Myxococcales bacterium]